MATVLGGLVLSWTTPRPWAWGRRRELRVLATVSHELRTPLHAIIGWVQLLKSGSIGPDETRRALEGIERNVRLEAQLVDELLGAAQLSEPYPLAKTDPIDLRTPIRAAIARVHDSASHKNVRIIERLGSSPVVVAGDARLLEEMTAQLLTNAVKFTPAGGEVSIDIATIGANACLRVADNGEGIAGADLPYVFEPFHQGRTRSKRTGLGLGLAIAKRHAAMHRGTISAHSAGPGAGAMFRVTLPLLSPRELTA